VESLHAALGRDLSAAAAAGELADLVEGVEALLDAYAADAVDLCPALERLLFDLLEGAIDAQAAAGSGPTTAEAA
jgi:hypothetical protein